MSPRRGARPTPPAWRRRLILGVWLGCGALILARAAQVQLLEAEEWRAIAETQHLASNEIPAPRGTILDRNGLPLVVSRERFEIAVAADQVRQPERDSLLAALREMGASRSGLRRIEDPREGRYWVPIGSRFSRTEWERVRRFHGVHATRHVSRELPYGDLALGVLGREVDGVWRGGIEQAFHDHLSGRPGLEETAKDQFGRPIPGQSVTLRDPAPGGDIVLTLDVDLQEIAEQNLEAAIRQHGARGGDLLVADPHTGEILALASIQGGNTNALSAINAPYEPGSTIKPFTMAAVLEHGVVSLEDSVDIGVGATVLRGRPLRDTHGSGVISYAEALRESSNIGVATAALGLTPRQHFEALRDFGFGTLTGLGLPGEVSGRLEAPTEWEKGSPVALAIGYELSVTPLQMVMAYGALANGGRLMEPRIVRELRSPSGAVERLRSRALRRVVEPALARSLGRVLEDVVEEGTGTRAQMETYRVAGKSGTARIAEAGGYSRDYFASFVGYFPADDPQIVVYAKLDAPQGSEYYGGAVAAPVTRATMEAALASRESPLSRSRLIRSNPGLSAASRADGLVDSRFVSLPVESADGAAPEPAVRGRVPVPEVGGLSPRAAVRRLHASGFRVAVPGSGAVVGTAPGAGTRLQPGDTVRLRVKGSGP